MEKNTKYILGALAIGGAYWYWNKMKKDKAAAAAKASMMAAAAKAEQNYTGDSGVLEYENAGGSGVRKAPYAGRDFDFSFGNMFVNPYKHTYRGR